MTVDLEFSWRRRLHTLATIYTSDCLKAVAQWISSSWVSAMSLQEKHKDKEQNDQRVLRSSASGKMEFDQET